MKRTDKESFVQEFRDRLKESPALFLTDFTGLDVKSMTDLRQELKKNGAEYLVVKNRLVKLALEELTLPDISEWLNGPTGVVLGHSGPVEAAKTVSDFAKGHDDKPVFKVAILDDALLTAEQIAQLAKLPPREQLLAMLAGALEAPMAALAGALEGKLQEMGGLMEALKEKKEGEGE
jgi:large subunit ribosomal protein L10